MTIKKIIISSITAVFILMGCRSFGQELPDDVFDSLPQAFGNTVQDVPPDLGKIEFRESLSRNGDVRVRASISVDSEISKFTVKKAFLSYRIKDSGEALTTVDMIKESPKSDFWYSQLQNLKAGVEYEFFISAFDEIGNSVVQLPTMKDLDKNNMTEVVTDDADKDIPKAMDILTVRFGYDGKDVEACVSTVEKFKSYSVLGASVVLVGFISDDVRYHPSRSITENTGGFIGYFPAMNKQGIFTVSQLSSGGDPIAPVKMFTAGKNVCMTAEANKLTTTPERGLKVFAATGAMTAIGGRMFLGDASPYSIVYFRGSTYTPEGDIP
ncbi:MAG TPA: hypothetical protein PLQ76_05610 [bacterium]|nr:hypothetical protein [bacterium]